jgi:cytochrome P450
LSRKIKKKNREDSSGNDSQLTIVPRRLYDLVVRPDLVQELRKEIKSVLDANDGVLSTHALFEMKLLDSVMKESQRTNPGNLVRFVRYVDKPVTLSDGTHLPAGSMIEAPHSNIVQDPQLYTNPEVSHTSDSSGLAQY